MNILIFAAREFNPIMGGIERVSSQLALFLKEKGHNVYFLCGLKTNGPDYTPVVRQFFLPNGFKGNSENREFILKIIEEYSINTIINQTDFGLLFSRGYIPKNVKIISVIHNSYKAMNMAKPNLYRKLRYRLAMSYFLTKVAILSDKIVVFSDKFISEYKYYCKLALKNKFCVIPNFNTYCNIHENFTKEKEVLFVGRLYNENKRVDRLLYIWKTIEKENLEWSLNIVGDGEDRVMLENLANNLKLKNVNFIGATNPEEYYKKASIFCMTSSYESFGMVLTEAMQFGVVPILFNSYATAEDIVCENKDGFLIEPFNLEDYSQKLKELMNNDDLRKSMSNEAKISVQKFSIENIGKSWIELLNRL